jgi:hypothetical protein
LIEEIASVLGFKGLTPNGLKGLDPDYGLKSISDYDFLKLGEIK